ncbi:ergothioneine biosynthesis protein EgtB [Blastopirellula marina]|uniref:Sulfatase-modifying factor enzyme domain-containing protein n=1 Tax=Blastopirellula marina DSM 3645 TaxID=314230 RepID=A3ZXF9_9BACT|nr:ergothioneine biosynthesis protein EgtB [Blastopirellula marina]EAQ78749.1 hypothetical protein DSM3645_29646 [Blastopirellula marina DSM 3645]
MSTAVDIRSEVLRQQFREVRQRSEKIAAPLEIEDFVVQSMPDASPIKWHLAHTTWFFETFVLQPSLADYVSPWPQFEYLFNSYYNTVGRPFPRSERGLLSRPTVTDVWKYRRYVDERIEEVMSTLDAQLLTVIELGVHHEQQHQELMLTDLKHAFSCNPLCPAYVDQAAIGETAASDRRWIAYEGGISSIGYDGDQFCYDNEQPAHQTLLEPYALASRLVTSGEYLEFMADGGYQDPQWWLSDGWNFLQSQQIVAPLYWRQQAEHWLQLTLGGLVPVSPSQPVHHVSYYEADAFARWAGHRLPTEQEWETAAQTELASSDSIQGLFLESEEFRPLPASLDATNRMQQLFGDVWQWTASPYTAYPRYRASAGALGEYNGKFMCNQWVLRGGSCVTPQSHIRATYRNFFGPGKRWQFSGIRLAKSI